jgi:ankyrin repeat protein
VSYGLLEALEHQFPSLVSIHAAHTPAHLTFFEHMQWHDLVDELFFLVSNDLSEAPHLLALLQEFSARADRYQRRSETMCVFHRTLLASGARALVDVPLKRGELLSALLYACENGLTNVIPALVTHGHADVEATDKDGANALCIAVTNGLADVSRLLLTHGADVNRRTHCLATPLYIASEMNWDDVLELLLASNANATSAIVGGATALCVAAKNGNHISVLRLLEAERKQLRGTSGGRQLHTPQHVQALFLACERGFVEIVRDILDRTDTHANVLMDASVAPLYLACQMGHDGVVALLLERQADPNFRRPNGGVSCLYIAAQEGKHHIVEMLVGAGVDIHARMDDLSTALHIAARMGHTSVAQVLVREGAGINDQTRSGLTPLYIASEEGHLAMVQFLLQLSTVNMNQQTKNGTTPLFVASQKSHTQVVAALLAAGANAHLPKHNGTYPMDAASLLGNYEVTKLLLQFGARVGGLSLHFAERRRDQKLQALLMDRYYEQHFQRGNESPSQVLTR